MEKQGFKQVDTKNKDIKRYVRGNDHVDFRVNKKDILIGNNKSRNNIQYLTIFSIEDIKAILAKANELWASEQISDN